MNRRMARSTAKKRLDDLEKRGLLLGRKFHYSHKQGLVKVYGTGDQMAELDKVWAEMQGVLGLAKMEDAWYV